MDVRSEPHEPITYSEKQILIAKSFKLLGERDASMNIIWETEPLKKLKIYNIKIAWTK